MRAAVEAPSPRVAKRNGERYGEGPVARALSFVEGRENGVAYAIDLLVDLFVAEADHPVALALHEGRPRLILGDFLGSRMGRAVDFDDKLGLAAGKIGVIRPNALLADEFMVAQRAAA